MSPATYTLNHGVNSDMIPLKHDTWRRIGTALTRHLDVIGGSIQIGATYDDLQGDHCTAPAVVRHSSGEGHGMVFDKR